MNIELRFLQKAIEDKNYISFSYENQKHSKVKLLELLEEEGVYTLKILNKTYDFIKMKKLQISREKF